MVLFLAVHEGAWRGERSVAAKLLSKDEARRIDACLSVPAHPRGQNVAEHGRSSSVLRSEGPPRPEGPRAMTTLKIIVLGCLLAAIAITLKVRLDTPQGPQPLARAIVTWISLAVICCY